MGPGELRPQLQRSQLAKATPEEFDEVARDLEMRGLLERQGRYRRIAPHPLAVFLAAHAWRTENRRIVSELLPELSEDMALSLFRRIADLGRYEPARSVLPTLLSRDGPFGSWESLERGQSAKLLTQLAIVLPDEVTDHLATLVRDVGREELASTPSPGVISCGRLRSWSGTGAHSNRQPISSSGSHSPRTRHGRTMRRGHGWTCLIHASGAPSRRWTVCLTWSAFVVKVIQTRALWSSVLASERSQLVTNRSRFQVNFSAGFSLSHRRARNLG